ncbi:MAG: serine/threonine-protein kinase, partial [Pseudomonadota bacterium]
MLGRRVGHYRLVSRLGKGGFGTVYHGEHVHLEDIQVAVKVFHPDLARDETFLALLRRECRVLHALAHPGIVAFRDLIIEGERAAIVLELLEGEDLHQHLRGRGPVSVGRAVEILAGILAPLGYAHRQGVVHRDIKPGNVFLGRDGGVKLMDFGIAKATGGSRVTQTGMLSGSLDYMASERFSGASLPASDLYAVGLTLWESLVGHAACVEGDLAAKMGWHMKVGPASLGPLRPDCPPWLVDFIAWLTAFDPDARPVDAEQALAELQRFQRAAPVAQSNAMRSEGPATDWEILAPPTPAPAPRPTPPPSPSPTPPPAPSPTPPPSPAPT